MHLKQIKIAGFKSFVDPTILPLPSQLIGIVGPNGCGKSNIIDALRWAIGESAAKSLRGETMTDVIFNGSSTRKAVGQASVELIFDNSNNRLTGQYASYQEIAVKRVITRDNDSSYFLNGTRCRRRDILDIFLGTGASSRGYSIISQGSISRIIEAKPEELRAFIEEAAGVTKYKERRRETLTRIDNTRQNLERCNDISTELHKQVARLERQAKVAAQYQRLKDEEKTIKIRIHALKWRQFQQALINTETELTIAAQQLDEQQTVLALSSAQYGIIKEEINAAQSKQQLLQNRYYQLNTEINQLKKNQAEWEQEKARVTNELSYRQEQLSELQVKQTTNDGIYAESIKRTVTEQHYLEQVALELTESEAELQLVTEQQQRLKNEWTLVQQQHSTAEQQFELSNVKLTHLQTNRETSYQRLEKIQHQEQEINDSLSGLHELNDEQPLLQLNQDKKTITNLLEELTSRLTKQSDVLANKEIELRQLKNQQTSAAMNCTKLEVQIDNQINAIQPTDSEPQKDVQYLFQSITIDPTWQAIAEWILGANLQAKLVSSLTPLYQIQDISYYSGLYVHAESRVDTNKAGRLIDKVRGIIPLTTIDLNKIFTVDTLAEAALLLPNIQDEESVVTLQGVWLSKHWIKFQDNKVAPPTSLLNLERDLKLVRASCENLAEQVSCLELQVQQSQQAIHLLTAQKADAKNQFIRLEEKIIAAQNQGLQQLQTRERLVLQQQRLSDEKAEIMLGLEDINEQELMLNEGIILLSGEKDKFKQQLTELTDKKLEQTVNLEHHQQIVKQKRGIKYQLQLKLERLIAATDQARQTTERLQHEFDTTSKKITELTNTLAQINEPNENDVAELARVLEEHKLTELDLTSQNDHVSIGLSKLSEQDDRVKKDERHWKVLDDNKNHKSMALQAVTIHINNLNERIEHDFNLETIINCDVSNFELPFEENALQQLVKKISTLGAVNLAALDEYTQEAQRKTDLDLQIADLQQALSTLESAIRKMDAETAERIKQTFDDVNQAFSHLFPRLFGGGRAQLTLTCDNVLEAGIIIMAEPPGKRNNTIHLLSGGEKALTAVALIFAIFQLNPSPFCLLDEVDAPLDDLNVSRFCKLVKEMSEYVQFVFITHNKLTMELAGHLIGVTMKEAGVSRIVTVDVNQALAMVN